VCVCVCVCACARVRARGLADGMDRFQSELQAIKMALKWATPEENLAIEY